MDATCGVQYEATKQKHLGSIKIEMKTRELLKYNKISYQGQIKRRNNDETRK